MHCSFQIETLTLPKHFLFDSLRLHAHFETAAVDLLALRFEVLKSHADRVVPLNVKLKVPPTRTKFTLVMQVRIINMRIRPCEVVVDLSALGNHRLQYVFRTEMGRVVANANIVELFSLPRELSVTSEESQLSEPSLAPALLSLNRSLRHQGSKEIKTNDEQEQSGGKGGKEGEEVVHFQA